jgi:predicted xylose isomerase-like sugar epimerase
LKPLDDAEFKEEAKAGAEAGVEYANKWGQKPLKMAKINDYEWLEEYYNEQNSS